MHQREMFGPGKIPMFYPGELHVITGPTGSGKTQTALKATLPMLTEHEGWCIDFIDGDDSEDRIHQFAHSLVKKKHFSSLANLTIRSSPDPKHLMDCEKSEDLLGWFTEHKSEFELTRSIFIVDNLHVLAHTLCEGLGIEYGYNKASRMLKELSNMGPTVIANAQGADGTSFGPLCGSANVVYEVKREVGLDDVRRLDIRKNRLGARTWNKKGTKICIVGAQSFELVKRAPRETWSPR